MSRDAWHDQHELQKPLSGGTPHPWINRRGDLSQKGKRQLEVVPELTAALHCRQYDLPFPAYYEVSDLLKSQPVVRYAPRPIPEGNPHHLAMSREQIQDQLRALTTSDRSSGNNELSHKLCIVSPDQPICVFADKWSGAIRIHTSKAGHGILHDTANALDQEPSFFYRDIKEIGRSGIIAAALTGIGHASWQPHPLISTIVAATSFAGACLASRLDTNAKYRRFANRLDEFLNILYNAMDQHNDTLDLSHISKEEADILSQRLEECPILSIKDGKKFLIDLSLGVTVVDNFVTPLPRGVLDTVTAQLTSFIHAYNNYLSTKRTLLETQRKCQDRLLLGVKTADNGVQALEELKQCQELAHDAWADAFSDLIQYVEFVAVAQHKEKSRRTLENERNRLEKALSILTETPSYKSEVCRCIHEAAFTAFLGTDFQHDNSNPATATLLKAYDWIKHADGATDDYADTATYYAAFYEVFHETLPNLPTPEKFAELYPRLALGLDH